MIKLTKNCQGRSYGGLQMSGQVEAYFDPHVKKTKNKKKHTQNLFTSLADSEDIYQAVMIRGLWEQISVTSV